MRLLIAGDPNGAPIGGMPMLLALDDICGVVMIVSSISSSMSSSSELDESLAIACVLPSDPLTFIVLWLPMIDHRDEEVCSGPPKPLGLRPGMFIARPPIVGDESGLDCSASVE
jgi:hypothetical protein